MNVTLQHLTKRFPNRNKKQGGEVVAVDDFTYEIPDGKLVGLLGPSGCGKSTTLYMICGLQAPTEGKIFFGDKDVTQLPTENRGVGLVFQNYALYPHMTVLQNILFPLENLKGRTGPARRRWFAGPQKPPSWCRSILFWTGSPVRCPAASSSGLPSHGRW